MPFTFEQVDNKNNPVERNSCTDWFDKLTNEQKKHIEQVTERIINALNDHNIIERVGTEKLPIITFAPISNPCMIPVEIKIIVQHYGLFDEEDSYEDGECIQRSKPVVNDLFQLTTPEFIHISICKNAGSKYSMRIQY